MFKFFDFIISIGDFLWQLINGAIEYITSLMNFIMQGTAFLACIIEGLPPFASGFVFCMVGIALASLFIGVIVDF